MSLTLHAHNLSNAENVYIPLGERPPIFAFFSVFVLLGWDVLVFESFNGLPLLEATTMYLQGKYGVEIRIESVNKDNSHSWVRISHGLNKLVTDLIDKEYDDKEQESSETKTEAFALKTDVLAFASRSKAKAKPRRPTSDCSSTKTVLNQELNSIKRTQWQKE